MAKETKVGLLIGLALILLVGIILSDLVSGPAPGVAGQEQATHFGAQAQNDIYAPTDSRTTTRSHERPSVVESGAPASAVPDAFRTQPAFGQGTATPRSTSAADPPLILPSPRIEADRGSPQQQLAPAPQRRPDLPEPDTREAAGPSVAELPQAWRVDRAAVAATTTPTTSVPDPALSATPDNSSFFIPPPPQRAPDVAPAADRGSDDFHVVGPRDTLSAVARKHYGDPAYATGLSQANPRLVVGVGGTLQPGDRLTLPPLDSPFFKDPSVAANTPAPEPLPPAPPQRATADAPAGTVTVAPGDTLSGLAAQHLGSSQRWDELLNANADVLRRPEALREGMVLRLPTAHATASQPAAAANATPGAAAAAARTYTVKAGDNLTRIAARALGDGQRWDDIFAANRDQLDRPEGLRAGMVLKLPSAAAAPATQAPPRAPSAAANTYTVKAGDNLTRIAARTLGNGQRWDEIFNANRDQLDGPESIRVGQVLVLP